MGDKTRSNISEIPLDMFTWVQMI